MTVDPDQPDALFPLPDQPDSSGPGPDPEPDTDGEDPRWRIRDEVTGCDRASLMQALTVAAERERQAQVDQLVLIARAAEVWSWVDNLDDVVDDLMAGNEPDPNDPEPPNPAPGGSPGQMYGERLWRFGADGSPEVSEFLRLEVGPALGIPPDSAARMIGDVLDLRHRLPGLWGEVQHDRVRGWVACKVAYLTRTAKLPYALCLELDRRISGFAPGWTPHKIIAQTKKLIVLLDPDGAEAQRRKALAARFVEFWTDHGSEGDGTVAMRAQLDGVDGLDLEATIDALADVLETLDPETPRKALRAHALELLADPARAAAILNGDITSLSPPGTNPDPGPDPGPDPSTDQGDDSADSDAAAAEPEFPPDDKPGPRGVTEAFIRPAGTGREVTLIVHVSPADLVNGAGGDHPRLGVLVRSQLDTLLAGAGKVMIKPVLDPTAVTLSRSAVPPPGMRDRIQHRNPSVVFPFSDRSSASAGVDLDHTVPWPQGATTEPNLGPLDRQAHRYKTHTPCTLTQVRNGVFQWTTAAGQTFWVTPHGTFRKDPGPGVPRPADPTGDLIDRAKQAARRAADPDPARPDPWAIPPGTPPPF